MIAVCVERMGVVDIQFETFFSILQAVDYILLSMIYWDVCVKTITCVVSSCSTVSYF